MARTKRILVVDDDVDFADSVVDLLRSEGHRVAVAYGGHEAVTKTRTRTFDLTLMDMQMPGIDGVDTLRGILDIRPSAEVVMMTGFSIPEKLNAAASVGAAALMQKPLDMARLRELIDDVNAPLIVLIADDDEDFSESLRSMLEDAGYVVITASNGAEAVECTVAQRPDLLLLDLRMPDLGGVGAYRSLLDQGLQPPTIILSAYVDEERDALDKDMHGIPPDLILHKPITSKHLLRLVERVVGVP